MFVILFAVSNNVSVVPAASSVESAAVSSAPAVASPSSSITVPAVGSSPTTVPNAILASTVAAASGAYAGSPNEGIAADSFNDPTVDFGTEASSVVTGTSTGSSSVTYGRHC